MRHQNSRVLEREVLEAAGVEILCMEEVGEHAHQPHSVQVVSLQ